jgi:hypothetical protein
LYFEWFDRSSQTTSYALLSSEKHRTCIRATLDKHIALDLLDQIIRWRATFQKQITTFC